MERPKENAISLIKYCIDFDPLPFKAMPSSLFIFAAREFSRNVFRFATWKGFHGNSSIVIQWVWEDLSCLRVGDGIRSQCFLFEFILGSELIPAHNYNAHWYSAKTNPIRCSREVLKRMNRFVRQDLICLFNKEILLVASRETACKRFLRRHCLLQLCCLP